MARRPPMRRGSSGVRVGVEARYRVPGATAAGIRAQAAEVLRGEGRAGRVDVAVVCDREIAALNRRFLRRAGPTDVLSFPLGGPGGHLGDVVVSGETARREAARRGVPARAELHLYVVHGVLHLLGYDDRAPGPRRRMIAAEERYGAYRGAAGPRRAPARRRAAPAKRRPRRPASGARCLGPEEREKGGRNRTGGGGRRRGRGPWAR
jgi:probable rRNA maturation factor